MIESALPVERTCVNCACYAHMLPDGSIVAEKGDQTMTVCRRNEPGARMVKVPFPVFNTDGSPQLNGRKEQRTELRDVMQIGYRPIVPSAVCFDGWRPLGTVPGVRWEAQRMLEAFLPWMEKALQQSGVAAKQARQMADAMLTGVMGRDS